MIRLIASDIDGTLLHNGAAEIDPVIFEEIHRLKQKGILFCPPAGGNTTACGGCSPRRRTS